MKNRDGKLFYTCALIEYIGRKYNLDRKEVVTHLGEDNLKRLYEYADVFHCDIIEKVAEEFAIKSEIKKGHFDNISNCKYKIPDYWDIGEVYERLILDVSKEYTKEGIIATLKDVYNSKVSDKIQEFNTDMYYQPRDYICECYKAKKILCDDDK